MRNKEITKIFLTILGACTLFTTVIPSSAQADALKLFWGNYSGDIYSANPDGSNALVIYNSTEIIFGMDIDSINNKIYFADSDSIKTSNLDGSNVQVVISGTADYRDVAIDEVAGRIYYADYSGKVGRVNTDGTNEIILTTITPPEVNSNPAANDIVDAQLKGIEIDLQEQKIYVADQTYDRIYRLNFDGTGQESFTDGTDSRFNQGVALDEINRKLYFTAQNLAFEALIRQINLDGTGQQDIISGLDYSYHVEVDARGQKLYFTDESSSNVYRTNLDGSNQESLASGAQITAVALLHDVDLDDDGTPDPLDNCDEDPNKSGPGACGCGVADADNNQNAIFDCQVNDIPHADAVAVEEMLSETTYRRGVTQQLLTSYRTLVTSIANAGFAGFEDDLKQLRRAITRLKYLKTVKKNKRQFKNMLENANAQIVALQERIKNLQFDQ